MRLAIGESEDLAAAATTCGPPTLCLPLDSDAVLPTPPIDLLLLLLLRALGGSPESPLGRVSVLTMELRGDDEFTLGRVKVVLPWSSFRVPCSASYFSTPATPPFPPCLLDVAVLA